MVLNCSRKWYKGMEKSANLFFFFSTARTKTKHPLVSGGFYHYRQEDIKFHSFLHSLPSRVATNQNHNQSTRRVVLGTEEIIIIIIIIKTRKVTSDNNNCWSPFRLPCIPFTHPQLIAPAGGHSLSTNSWRWYWVTDTFARDLHSSDYFDSIGFQWTRPVVWDLRRQTHHHRTQKSVLPCQSPAAAAAQSPSWRDCPWRRTAAVTEWTACWRRTGTARCWTCWASILPGSCASRVVWTARVAGARIRGGGLL